MMMRVSYLNVGPKIKLEMQKDNGRRVTLAAVQADYNYLSGNLAETRD